MLASLVTTRSVVVGGLAAIVTIAAVRAQGSWSDPFNHLAVPNASATDHLIPFGGYLNANISYYTWPLNGKTYRWPAAEPSANNRMFNAVHMALIPKGPYQGMVLVWNTDPVLIKAPGYGPVTL